MEESIERRTGRVSDAWATRPSRPREGRVIAGVCRALGDRYDVDPVLVRVAFVVAAFYGPGIPLYLAGCAVLPDGGSTGSGRARTVLSTVLLIGAAVVGAGLLFGGEGGWVAPLMVCVGLLALLHVTRGGTAGGGAPAGAPGAAPAGAPGAAPAGPPGAAHGATTAALGPAGAPTGPVAADASVPGARPGGDVGAPPVPPAWDPLGAAPFAWDLPEPSPEREPEPVDRSRLTPLTLGVALLAAGAAGVAALAAPGAVAPAVVPAAALAVVGVGLVIGAFRHAGRWLLPFAVVLAVATWLVGVLPWPELRGGVGSVADAPTAATAVAPEYRRGVGDVALDLSGLDLRTPPGAPPTTVRTAARVGVGSITVTVPPDADVVVRATSDLGDVTALGRTRSGSAAQLTVVDDGPDGPGGGRIELDASAELGSVTVSRG